MVQIYNYHTEGKYVEITYSSRADLYKLALKTRNCKISKQASTLASLWTQIEVEYRENTNPLAFPTSFYKLVREKLAKILQK